MSWSLGEDGKIRRGVRIICGCIAVFMFSGALLTWVFEKNWKLLISGGSLCIMFGYLAVTGRTPNFLR
jgi:hypothetical protein